MPKHISPHVVARKRLDAEIGRLTRNGPRTVALAYPSTYRVAMSSLGYQTVYRLIQESGIASAARVFAHDAPSRFAHCIPELSYETGDPMNAFPLVAFSIAWELELGTMLGMLSRARIPVLSVDRDDSDPLVVAGGPLTMSNPRPLAPFIDAVLVGEAEGAIDDMLRHALGDGSRSKRLECLAGVPSVWVPALHGDVVPEVRTVGCEDLPAWGPVRTPAAALSDMFLVEAVRGCSRRCRYCVMRGSGSGSKYRGMRVVPAERVLSIVPDDAAAVGLVGASVSDHPGIDTIVEALAIRGCSVGLSSLRPDRLNHRLLGLLRLGGYKTITTALDGASQRLRDDMERKTTAEQVMQAALACRNAGILRLKLYLMVGLPGESDVDVYECADLVRELTRVLPVSLGVSTFCAKFGTPLADAPFAGIDVARHRIQLLRRLLAGHSDIRSTSTRWAWVEHMLARGGAREGIAVLDAERAGGTFSHYRTAFEGLQKR